MRIECSGVEFSAKSNKYSVKFDLFRGSPGNEHIGASTQSASVFDTEDQAYEGARRAMNAYGETGVFPNMCEVF